MNVYLVETLDTFTGIEGTYIAIAETKELARELFADRVYPWTQYQAMFTLHGPLESEDGLGGIVVKAAPGTGID